MWRQPEENDRYQEWALMGEYTDSMITQELAGDQAQEDAALLLEPDKPHHQQRCSLAWA